MSQNTKPHLSTDINLPTDLVCFSHLRWNFVYQRPQHLLSRFAKVFRLFFIEEPILTPEADSLLITLSDQNVWVIVPHLQEGLSSDAIEERQKVLLKNYFKKMEIKRYIFWYYTPMALGISAEFTPEMVVYDCMDELSAFKFAPPELKKREAILLSSADLVFTGGHSLYEAKKSTHNDIHPFPSSIDKGHFATARNMMTDPTDQATIPNPRFGFYGVIDERLDIKLISDVAIRKPEWHFIIVGPVVKIDPASLPALPNIHYLGSKTYNELPSYLSGWDVAMIPFELNESTRYISPTKTPEYLAAGKPVISTSIRDVIQPYKTEGLVHIADSAEEFISAAEYELGNKNKQGWLENVDEFLAENSWDNTWMEMMQHITRKSKEKSILKTKTKEQMYV